MTENNVDSDVQNLHNKKESEIIVMNKKKINKIYIYYLAGFEPVPSAFLLSSVL